MMKDAAANKITGVVISHKHDLEKITNDCEEQISNIESKLDFKEKEHYNLLTLKDTEIETLNSKYNFFEQNIAQMRTQQMDVFNEQTRELEIKIYHEKEQSEKGLREKYDSLLQERDFVIEQKETEVLKIKDTNEKYRSQERNSQQQDSNQLIAQLTFDLENEKSSQSQTNSIINEQNRAISNLNQKIENYEQEISDQRNMMQQFQESQDLEKTSLENNTKREIEIQQVEYVQKVANLDQKIKFLDEENELMQNEIKNYKSILQESQQSNFNSFNQNDEIVKHKEENIRV